jgi:hypothetical protein
MTGRVAHGRPFIFCFHAAGVQILFTRNFGDRRLNLSFRGDAKHRALMCNCTSVNLIYLKSLHLSEAGQLTCAAIIKALSNAKGKCWKRSAERWRTESTCHVPELEPNFRAAVTVLPMRIFGLRPAAHLHLTRQRPASRKVSLATERLEFVVC